MTTLATWTIDPVHSSVEFSLDYMGFSTYRTGFRALEGSIEFDAARPAGSSVAASIPVSSVDVTNDRLMSRLMDPDLLGGRDHPTIAFTSTRVETLDAAHWNVTGDLTIRGVTRPIVLDTRYLGQAQHPFGKKIAAGESAPEASGPIAAVAPDGRLVAVVERQGARLRVVTGFPPEEGAA